MTRHPIAVIISGLSGAGKNTALRALEDAGFRIFDALPARVLAESGADILGEGPTAFIVDIRTDDPVRADAAIEDAARAVGAPLRRVYLEAAESTLVRRYAESRRPHPLADVHPTLADALAAERATLAPIRDRADAVIATDLLEPRALAAALLSLADGRPAAIRPALAVISFGFKHGIPAEAEWVLDVRSLPNPHYDPELRTRDGRDRAVADYALANPRGERFLAAFTPLLATLLDAAAADGRRSVTVAIGCTGGIHRSVATAEAIAAEALRSGLAGTVRVHHRDVARH
jgi:UPF0042 nucleotide-binding protein